MYTLFMGLGGPTANIAVNKNRIKQYAERVYLKNGTHFEIELFNPKNTKVLAKIYLDGKSISSNGIVIKPGQRVFLERWLDVSKKFLYETYDIDGSIESAQATQENGKVRVEFFDEKSGSTTTYTMPYCFTGNATAYPHPTIGYGSSISYAGSTVSNTFTTLTSSTALNASYETGRTEAGESSNQNFSSDSSQYASWASEIVNIRILPDSTKPVEVHEIRNYCTSCGTRHKKSSWKFCPNCGTKI
jgi:hypothetical protein